MRTKFKAWTGPYLEEHKEASFSYEELETKSELYLEIGSGKGDFLLKMALKNPDKTFVGIEKNVTCAGIATKKIVDSKIENAKLIFDDALNVTPHLKVESVNYIFLNFSDPWPKKRHHKRRLTSDNFLKEYLRILKKGGYLIFKTDNVDLFNDSLEYFATSPFKQISVTNNYEEIDEFDAITEYEERFRNEGTPINRVIYQK